MRYGYFRYYYTPPTLCCTVGGAKYFGKFKFDCRAELKTDSR